MTTDSVPWYRGEWPRDGPWPQRTQQHGMTILPLRCRGPETLGEEASDLDQTSQRRPGGDGAWTVLQRMRTAQRDRAGERNSRKRTDHMEAGSHQHIWGLLLDGDRSINKFTALFTSHCVMGREGKKERWEEGGRQIMEAQVIFGKTERWI